MLTRSHFHLSYLLSPSVCSSLHRLSLAHSIYLTPHSLPQKQIKPRDSAYYTEISFTRKRTTSSIVPCHGPLPAPSFALPFVARPKPRNCPPSSLSLSLSFLFSPLAFFSFPFFYISLYVSLFPTHSVLIRLSCIFYYFFLSCSDSNKLRSPRSHPFSPFLHARSPPPVPVSRALPQDLAALPFHIADIIGSRRFEL